ncbi:hypothetical protein CLAIMM_02004 isoform 1 [Cladophialophora immunda]|nr:hypothetical protein CLAIMM_02004 isoform 1 [Cladophialophora immunda]
MSALTNTIWPEGLPPPPALQSWLSKLFETVDSKAPDSGEQLAGLYADNAVIYGMHGRSEGKEAIAASRKSAWDNFEFRKHEVLQVFCGKADYSEIALIGKLTAVLKNGNQVVTEFIAQIKFAGDVQQSPEGVLYKVWGDSAPWIKAIQK